MKKEKNKSDSQEKIEELTQDLQRVRADFENYRRRVEDEKTQSKKMGEYATILKLLPVVDNIERAIVHVPKELKDNTWANGVIALQKQLESSLKNLGVTRIDAKKGVLFNPDFHEAIQFDENADGEQEVIQEELQAGYLYHDTAIRHAMVKVTSK